MPTWIWIIIAVVIAAVVFVAVEMTIRRRRTAKLQRRFGPEYDRTVGASETQRSAEADLAARQERRSRLQINPLPQATRERFIEEWRTVQQQFVDQPSHALVSARGVVDRVLDARGYPTGDSKSQAELLSVDHPHSAESYRVANEICERARVEQAGTEELRDGLLRYRALFEELVEGRADEGAAVASQGGGDPANPTEATPLRQHEQPPATGSPR